MSRITGRIELASSVTWELTLKDRVHAHGATQRQNLKAGLVRALGVWAGKKIINGKDK
jgi:hypothetical protein